MRSVAVRTKEELRDAAEGNVKKIEVIGDLAEELNRALKIRRVSKYSLALLGASLAAVPLTGGISLVVAAPVAALTGIEIALIIAVAALGVSLVLLICKNYKKVHFRGKTDNSEAELILEREDAVETE